MSKYPSIFRKSSVIVLVLSSSAVRGWSPVVVRHSSHRCIFRASNDDEIEARRAFEDLLGETPMRKGPRESLTTPRINKAARRGVALQDNRVPEAQQPAQELEDLKASDFFNLASKESFPIELLKIYSIVFTFISLPIAATTYSLSSETSQALITANVGTLGVMFAFVVRLWVGWSYVGDRLVKEVGYYEESGWYDGFMSTKPVEIRARDRLIYEFEVEPVLGRLKSVLIGTCFLVGLSLLVLHFAVPDDPYAQFDPEYLSTLQLDDGKAEAERLRAAAGGVYKPTYCDSRYYRAVAGASGC